MNDKDLIKYVISLWYAEKKWAEELLRKAFNLKEARDILESKHRGDKQIPETNWRYRTHGIGVDIYRTADVGGIDFDFDKPDPDQWRLQIFLEKQYNAGNLAYDLYRHLFENEGHLKSLLEEVLR